MGKYRFKPRQQQRRPNQQNRWQQGQHEKEHQHEHADEPRARPDQRLSKDQQFMLRLNQSPVRRPEAVKKPREDWMQRVLGGDLKKEQLTRSTIKDVGEGRLSPESAVRFLKSKGIDHHRIESAVYGANSERIRRNIEPLIRDVRDGRIGEKNAWEAIKAAGAATPDVEKRLHDAEGECLLEMLTKKGVIPKSPQRDELIRKALREGDLNAWKKLQSPRKILELCVGLEHQEDPMRKERLNKLQNRQLRALNRVSDLKKANQIDDATYLRIHTWLMEDGFY